MNSAPSVSVVIPLFNDEAYVASALDSCLAQTLNDIEIICVDDASTDSTVEIVRDYARRDSRVSLLQHDKNRSAFQARRTGVLAASAPLILFLDGDDALSPAAAQVASSKAQETRADVVGFGVSIVAPVDGFPARFEAALQPQHEKLQGAEIVPGLFPIGVPANGHLWRYAFATSLLRRAYEGVPESREFYRANDLPITFLALANAEKYVSVPDRLYRYHFRRGTSGHTINDIAYFDFLLSGIDPVASIGPDVQSLADELNDPRTLTDSYESARLSVIAHVLRYCIRDTSGSFQAQCIARLKAKVSETDAVRAAAGFCPEALKALTGATDPASQPSNVRNVLLTTMHLDTGGLQSVLLEHVDLLRAQGYTVTVAVMRDSEREIELPEGVDLVRVDGDTRLQKIDSWVAICREFEADVIVDHHILYNTEWPWFALAALAAGVPTIGWIHSFSLRPLFDGSQRTSFLAHHMRILHRVVTLSPTDVAFWKLQGIERVVYLPNPPSSLAREALATVTERRLDGGRIELAWWGRLDQQTKQVLHLVEIAAMLSARGVDFRLTIVGPNSKNLSAKDVRERATALGVSDKIDLLGEQTASELLAILSDAHVLVSTSAIEGYQLTVVEAQALGMPVVMYDLPWLTTTQGNEGLIAVDANQPAAMAEAIAHLAQSPEQYEMLSRSSRSHAESIISADVGELLAQLLTDELPAEYSPAPTITDATMLAPLMIGYSERSMRRGRAGGSRADAQLAAAHRERDRAQSKLRHIEQGPSFRIGRAITLLPRRAKALIASARGKDAPIRAVRGGAPVTQQPEIAPPPPLRWTLDSAPPVRVAVPDVTVVVPVYNSEAWLDDCLSGVLAQTGVDVELICVNDGSTDGSRAVLQRFADADNRVTVIDQPNSGQSVGRNVGLERATGRYVIYLDSDDYWPFDVLADLVKNADRDSLDVLLFDCLAFREGEIDEKTWKWYSTYYQRTHTYRGVKTGVELMASMRRGRDYKPHVGLYMTRTEYVRDAGIRFIPGIVHQDNPYTFRLLLNAARVAHQRLDVYARRVRPGSTITTLTAERSARGYFLSYLEMSRELEIQVLEKGSTSEVKDIVDGVYEGARKQLSLISDAAAEQIRRLDSTAEAQSIFDELRIGA